MRQIRLYYIIEFLSALFTQWVFTLTPIYYILKGHFNPLQLILIGVVLESTVLIFEIPTGYLADKKSRILSFALGYGLMGISFGILVYKPYFIFSLVYSFFLGLGYTFVSGAQTAWILDETDKNLHQSLLIKSSQFTSFGGIIGIGLAVFVSLNHSIEQSILISGIGLIFLSLFILFNAKEKNFIKQHAQSTKNLLRNSFELVQSHKILKSLLLIALFYGFASEGFDSLWGLKVFGFNQLTEIESVWVVGGLTMLVYVVHILLMKWIENRVNKPINVIIYLNSLLVFSILLFALNSSIPYILLFYSLSSTLRSINYPLFSIINNQYLESYGRATLLSFFGQMDAMGQIVGGLLIGFFANILGVEFGLILTALLHCIIVIAIIHFKRIKSQ